MKTITQNLRWLITLLAMIVSIGAWADDIFTLYTGEITEGDYIIFYNGKAMMAEKSANYPYLKPSSVNPTGDKITIKGSTESISYIIAIRGDNNGDGVIDLKDFVLCQSHILKKMTLADEKFIASDVNYDGVVDLKDFVLIQSHILKKLTL